jgi:hypothetical protein
MLSLVSHPIPSRSGQQCVPRCGRLQGLELGLTPFAMSFNTLHTKASVSSVPVSRLTSSPCALIFSMTSKD